MTAFIDEDGTSSSVYSNGNTASGYENAQPTPIYEDVPVKPTPTNGVIMSTSGTIVTDTGLLHTKDTSTQEEGSAVEDSQSQPAEVKLPMHSDETASAIVTNDTEGLADINGSAAPVDPNDAAAPVHVNGNASTIPTNGSPSHHDSGNGAHDEQRNGENGEVAHVNGVKSEPIQVPTEKRTELSLEPSQRVKGDNYALKRDASANSRLIGQHYYWKDTLGFLLHPSIPIDKPNLRVADVATGNSIWLQDLSQRVGPQTQLHGFDISLDQTPPAEWLPPNMALHTWSLFDEVPAEFVGSFDVVHVRLITVVVRNDDPSPILANLARLLKPGGFLQWDEVDSIGCYVKTVPSKRADSLERLLRQLGGTDRWKYNLVNIMEQQGWQKPALHCFEYGLVTARFWNDIYVATWREFAQQVLKTPEESAILEQAAMREVREGAAIICPKLVWVAQKPPVV